MPRTSLPLLEGSAGLAGLLLGRDPKDLPPNRARERQPERLARADLDVDLGPERTPGPPGRGRAPLGDIPEVRVYAVSGLLRRVRLNELARHRLVPVVPAHGHRDRVTELHRATGLTKPQVERTNG